MYLDFNTNSEDEEQWLEGLESSDDELEMKEAVRIQDPISSLGLASPLTAEIGTSLKNALNILQQKKQNCLLIVNNGVLVGILTERDLLLKVTGKGFDFDVVTVDEFMTENPEYLSSEDPLAYALNKMHIGGFRHVPILNDDRQPIGLISISNIISTIADYFSREIINLPPLDRLVDSDKREGG
ncbi:CBS domain-containing protein [Candidatus Marinimicrobia bacterium]|nr:CBS domain-containing protein [Candidatus Neomarinimicrobiota bacterium]